MSKSLGCLLFFSIWITLAPIANATVVGQGNACERDGEGSQFQGVYLVCTNGIWTAQAPQAISAGLSAVSCTAARLGLLRIQVLLGTNSLQFCDGSNWKTISLL